MTALDSLPTSPGRRSELKRSFHEFLVGRILTGKVENSIFWKLVRTW